MKRVLITGGAGFIGSNLIDALLKSSDVEITCLDNFDPFYDPKIKRSNIKSHLKNSKYKLIEGDIRNLNKVRTKLSRHYDAIIHLAARVGVIPSLNDPKSYTEVNVLGTQNLLEFAKSIDCKKFIFASSSSIYGINKKVPWSESDNGILPISPYAATKVSGELLGHVYSYLYDIQFIGLRFFTVYGPRQRPDLVIHKFTKLISEGKTISIFGDGKTQRDYTYVEDIVSGIIAALDFTGSQYEIINLGNNKPVELSKLITSLEGILKKKAFIKYLPERAGDVPLTYADIKKAQKILKYQPKTHLLVGLQKFVSWFKLQKGFR